MSEYKDFLAHFKGKMNESESAQNITPEEETTEKNIKTAPLHQTSGNSQVHIPDSDEEEIIPAESARFIKTGTTPFVSVTEEINEDEDTTDVEKYTDRLSQRAKDKKRTVKSASASSYTLNHSADSETEKFRIAEEENETDKQPEEAAAIEENEEFSELDGKTKVLEISEDFGDILAETESPTKYIDPSSKGSLMREIALTANDDVRQNPDQLMMDGFDTSEQEEKEKQAALEEEKELEKELSEVRRKRVNNFHFWNKQEHSAKQEVDDENFSADAEKTSLPLFLKPIADKFSEKFSHLNSDFTPVDCEEFEEFESRKAVFTRLLETRRSTLIKTAIIALLGIVLLIINTAASVSASNNNGFFSLFGGSNTVFVAINLVFLLIASVVLAKDLKNGLFSLLKVHPKTDTSLLFMIVAAFVQNVASFFTQLKIEENYHLFTACVILLCVPYLLGKLFYYDNIRHCFKAVGAKSDKSYLRRISDEETVSSLLRDSESASSNVVYSGKTKFISNFLERSAKSAYSAMPSSRTVVICIAFSLLAGIIAWIAKGSFLYGVSALTMCAAFSFPVCCITATGFFISKENKKLSLKTSFVHSYTDARGFAEVDNIVINAEDIFEAEIKNVLPAKGVNEKQAQFCAAVLTSNTSSPVSDAFKAAVAGLEDRFPKVEDYVYEDKLGHSAWIQNCRVLLGSTALLVNHSVQAPDENSAMRFLNETERPLFLSLEGHFAAMFAVEYRCKAEIKENLRSLVETGTNILISSNDPNITEEYAEQLLGLPANSVRIISPSAAEKLNSAKNTVTEKEDAGIVFNSSFESLCRCAGAALRLNKIKKICKLISEGGAFVGLILSFILVITGAFNTTAAFMPVILQLVWMIICFALPAVSGSSPVKKGKTPVHKQTADSLEDINEESYPTEENEEENENTIIEEPQTDKNIFLNKIKNTVKKVSVQARVSEEQEETDSENSENTDNEQKNFRSETEFSHLAQKTKFSLFGDSSEKREAKSEAQLAEEKKEMHKKLHFTPPEMPEPPQFSFRDEKKKEEEDPLNAKFVPPEDTTPINVYDDNLFSRYEDDNIFAGLKEENKKKFDF